MNKKRFYAIYDKKAGIYHNPQPIMTDAEAKRVFGFLRTNKDDSGSNLIAVFPEDYELHFIGEFDCITGLFDHSQKCILVGSAELPAMPSENVFTGEPPVKRRKTAVKRG